MTKEQSKPNILFLIVDSLRSDKSYGNERTCITPNLDSIIKKGTFFNQAISPSDATRLSIKSIFTSQIPSKINDIESITDSIQSPKIPTLVSVLKKSGYKIFGTLPELEALKSIYYEFNDNDKFSTSSLSLFSFSLLISFVIFKSGFFSLIGILPNSFTRYSAVSASIV